MKKMNHFYKFVSGCAGIALLFVSCFDEKDFDFDKLNYDNLHPAFHLPLLSDTLRITDAIDGENLQFINGQGYFVFDVGNIDMPEVTNLFEFPSQQLGFDIFIPLPTSQLPTPGVPIPDINITFPGFTYPQGEPGTLTTDPLAFGSDVELKSIKFSGGSIMLTNKHTFIGGGTLTVEIPALKKNNQSLSKKIVVTTTTPQIINLDGYEMTVPDGNVLNIKYQYEATSFTLSSASASTMTDIPLGLDISLSNIAIAEASGYFGKHTEYARQSIDIGDFNDINGTWDLKEASIVLDIKNSIELPLRVVIDTIRSYTSTSAQPAAEAVRVDSITISTGTGVHTLTIPGNVISVLPKKMDVVVKVQSNPDGPTGQDNVIRSAGSASASATVLVPLKLRNIDITVKDTLDFNVSDISFSELGLLLNVKNSLPLGVRLQCELLKKGSNEILGNLFDTPVEIPAGNTTPEGIDESKVTSPSETNKFIPVKDGMAAKLKETDRLIVSFTAFTGNNNGTYVRVTESDHVALKIGVSAGINVGDLMDL
jgi:hypothetical protein